MPSALRYPSRACYGTKCSSLLLQLSAIVAIAYTVKYSRACRNHFESVAAAQLIVASLIPQLSSVVVLRTISFPLIAPSLLQSRKVSRDSLETKLAGAIRETTDGQVQRTSFWPEGATHNKKIWKARTRLNSRETATRRRKDGKARPRPFDEEGTTHFRPWGRCNLQKTRRKARVVRTRTRKYGQLSSGREARLSRARQIGRYD